MATRRTLDTRSSARALYYTNAFTALRVLACTASARERFPLQGAEREVYEEFKRRGGTLHLYNKAAR